MFLGFPHIYYRFHSSFEKNWVYFPVHRAGRRLLGSAYPMADSCMHARITSRMLLIIRHDVWARINLGVITLARSNSPRARRLQSTVSFSGSRCGYTQSGTFAASFTRRLYGTARYANRGIYLISRGEKIRGERDNRLCVIAEVAVIRARWERLRFEISQKLSRPCAYLVDRAPCRYTAIGERLTCRCAMPASRPSSFFFEYKNLKYIEMKFFCRKKYSFSSWMVSIVLLYKTLCIKFY